MSAIRSASNALNERLNEKSPFDAIPSLEKRRIIDRVLQSLTVPHSAVVLTISGSRFVRRDNRYLDVSGRAMPIIPKFQLKRGATREDLARIEDDEAFIVDEDWTTKFNLKLAISRRLVEMPGSQNGMVDFGRYCQWTVPVFRRKLFDAEERIRFLEKEELPDTLESKRLRNLIREAEKERREAANRPPPAERPEPFPPHRLEKLQGFYQWRARARELLPLRAAFFNAILEKKREKFKDVPDIVVPPPLAAEKDPFGETYWYNGTAENLPLPVLLLPNYPDLSEFINL